MRPAVAVAAAGAVAGCGSGDGTPPVRGATLISQDRMNSYTCADWRRAGPAEQKAAIDALRTFAGGMITGRGAQGRGAVLEDDHARRLFHSVCQRRHARHFVLYKLYTHAAAFAGR